MIPGKPRQWVFSILVSLLLTACSKPADTPEGTSSAAPAASPGGPDATPAMEAAPVDTSAAEAQLPELTQAVRKYAAEKQRAPKSLEEIFAAGYLPAMPAAPAGKTFAIDKKLQVYLADQ